MLTANSLVVRFYCLDAESPPGAWLITQIFGIQRWENHRKMCRYKQESQSFWSLSLSGEFFVFFKTANCPVLFSKRGSPKVRHLAELRFSLCCWEQASTWLPEYQGGTRNRSFKFS